MTTCALTAAYLDRRLDDARAAQAEAHLKQCPECARLVAAWREQRERLRRWAATAVPGPTEEEVAALTVVAARPARTRHRQSDGIPTRGLLLWAAAMAVVVLAVTASVIRFGGDAPSPGLRLQVLRGASTERATMRAGETLIANDRLSLLAEIGIDRVGLAANSRLRVIETHAPRVRLRLESGEAAFKAGVRSGAQQLLVEVGSIEVRVTGTQFLAAIDAAGGVRVGVGEGSVDVRAGERHMALWAGQSAHADGRGVLRSEALAPEDAAELVALLDLVPRARADAPQAPPGAPETGAAAPEVRSGAPQSRQVAPDGGAVTPETRAVASKTRLAAPVDPQPVGPAGGRGRARDGGDLDQWRLWVLAGEYARAEAALAAQVAADKTDYEAWSLLGDCRRQTGNWRAAVTAYDRVAHGGEPAAASRAKLLAASILQDQLGEHQRVITIMRDYLADLSLTPQLRTAAQVRLARSLIAVDEHDEAKRLLEEVLAADRSTPAALEAQSLMDRLQ